jgi:hypothetical protein
MNLLKLTCLKKLGGFVFMHVILGFFITRKPGLKNLEF